MKRLWERIADSLGLRRELAFADVLDNPLLLERFLSEKGCPGDDGLREAVERGLHEIIIKVKAAGCSVPGDIEREAAAVLIFNGKRPPGLYDVEPGGVAVAVCSDSRVVVGYGRFVLDTDSMGPGGKARVLSNSDAAGLAAWSLGASILVHWGCRTRYPRAVDASLLSAIAVPEAGGDIGLSIYHFSAAPGSVVDAVADIVSKSVALLESLGVDWSRMPPEVRLAPEATVAQGEPAGSVEIRRSAAEVIASDAPRLFFRTWRPYTIEPPGDHGYKGLEYAAYMAVRSIASRGGSVWRALEAAPAELVEPMLRLLRSSEIRPNPRPPEPGDQVEAADLGLAGWSGEVLLDCVKPLDRCLSAAPQASSSMPEDLGMRIEMASKKPASPRRRGRLRIRVRGWSPREIASMLGVETASQADAPKVRLVPPQGRGPLGLVEDLRRILKGEDGRILVITPEERLASLVAEGLGGYAPDSQGEVFHRWFVEGGLLVVPWDYLQARPEISNVADRSVVLLPEVMLRDETLARIIRRFYSGRAGLVSAQWGRIVELLHRLGAVGVSWAAGLGEPRSSRATVAGEVVDDVLAGVVNRLLGVSRLRPGQEAVLKRISRVYASLSPSVTIAVMPTGYGKSLLFQAPARGLAYLGYGALTLVVTPLKALMRDQTRAALGKGLAACYIDSSLSQKARGEVLRAAAMGLIDLLYIAPERFEDARIREVVEGGRLALAVLDEAHTASRWGETFRNSYLYMAKTLASLRLEEGWPPILALTATATLDIIESLVAMLGAADYSVVDLEEDGAIPIGGSPEETIVYRIAPVRPNIAVEARIAPPGRARLDVAAEHVRELAAWATGVSESWVGAVFTGFVKSKAMDWANAETIASRLEPALGGVCEVLVYHGQMGEKRRKMVEERAAEPQGRKIIVATKAFGMGVDIRNLRWTLHLFPSDSVEDLVQEIGRAGRDGLPARSLILFDPEDFRVRRAMGLRQLPRLSSVLAFYNSLVELHGREESYTLILTPPAVPPKVVRLLDILRTSGLLDYSITRRLHLYRLRKGVSWRDLEEAGVTPRLVLPRLGIVGFEEKVPLGEMLEPASLSIKLCMSPDNSFEIFYGRHGNTSGECRKAVIERSGVALLIDLNPDVRHRSITKPTPDLLVYHARLASLEALKVERLRKLLESLSVLRGEKSSQAFREGVREYFNRPLLRPLPENPEKALKQPRSIECTGVSKCRALAATLERLVEVLGPLGVTIAVPSGEARAAFLRAYGGLFPVEPRIVGVRKVLNRLKAGGVAAADLGYVVAITYKESQYNMLLSTVEGSGYPYVTVVYAKMPV
ncbi:ATP-dependent helicase [Aeropyrum pernix]|uniref:DNA 3'-5' helicase n=1 Tax=Aeropyrum pernix TaxID=56636 RepID=A0A401H920_AERPX|nr:DEAD/DEAH box helicase [Aeropyrum pernix]GBF08931.1 ATP-dependent helicase [Aeropyrum pernix]